MHFIPILAATEKIHTSIMDAVPHLAGVDLEDLALVVEDDLEQMIGRHREPRACD